MRYSFFHPAALVVGTIAVIVGCGNDRANRGAADESSVLPKEPLPLALASEEACLIDEDCDRGRSCFQNLCIFECTEDGDCESGESCGASGRCLSSSGRRARSNSEAQIRVAEPPDTDLIVRSGDDGAVLHLELSGEVPEEGIGYYVRRSDAARRPNALRRVHGVTSVDIPLPAAELGLEAGSGLEIVFGTVVSSIGDFAFTLRLEEGAGGEYDGVARTSWLGESGTPLNFAIVTEPEGVALVDAESAYWLVEVAGTNFFSPHEFYEGAPSHVAAPLRYDAQSNAWIATYDHEYRVPVPGTAGAPAAPIVQIPAGRLGRALRFELTEAADGEVRGNIVDRWEGLLESSSGGVVSPEDVIYVSEFSARRIGPTLTPEEVEALPATQAPAPNPPQLPGPDLAGCTDQMLLVDDVELGGQTYGCGALSTVGDFETGTASARASCAIAVGEAALAEESVAERLNDYLTGGDGGEVSFSEFLESCAQGSEDACAPSNLTLCARRLASSAFRHWEGDAVVGQELVRVYQATTRESYLGPQLAAFQSDMQARIQWLSNDNAPDFVAAVLEDENARLLDEWVENVLDVHLAVLATQLDDAALAVLAQDLETQTARDSRQGLLREAAQSWRAATESLGYVIRKWNRLFQGEARRREAAAIARVRLRDLYLAAGFLRRLNEQAGLAATSAQFSAAYSTTADALGQLDLPFQRLVFARDAEVVVSRSLDPLSTNDSLLSERQAEAEAQTETARTAVETLLQEVQGAALTEADLLLELDTEIDETERELVELCGLPIGCDVGDFAERTPGCDVQVSAGLCGFEIEGAGSDVPEIQSANQNVSRAGQAILTVASAAQDVRAAHAQLREFEARVRYSEQALSALATSVEEANVVRQAGLRQLESLMDQQSAVSDAAVESLRDALREKVSLAQDSARASRDSIRQWDRLRVADARTTFSELKTAQAFRDDAANFNSGSSAALSVAAAAAEGFPKTTGLSNDTTSWSRSLLLVAAASTAGGLKYRADRLEDRAAILELQANRDQSLRQAELERLQEVSAVEDAITEAEVLALDAEINASSALEDAELAQLERMVELSREEVAAQLAYERDVADVEQKRLRHLALVQEEQGFGIELTKSELGMEQRLLEYSLVVQQAELAKSRVEYLREQRAGVLELLGSPSVIFVRANRLDRSELFLQEAKDALMDWLVAIEYYAVRPFVDLRLQILLARNAYQLEAIGERLRELQNTCGGAVNTATVTASLVELLDLDGTIVSGVDGTELDSTARLREVLSQGAVPIDREVRYSSDENIGELLTDRGVLAASFDISLDDFANLGATCNAKVASMTVQLVGEIGEGVPTVSILYDGTSRLRSCQPDIEDYVNEIGRDVTAFGPVTMLRTAGRSTSPVAGINVFPEDAATRTFEGLPVASQYTVLIDPTQGDNSELDWDQLEDVRIQLEYQYQDVFPEGQCTE